MTTSSLSTTAVDLAAKTSSLRAHMTAVECAASEDRQTEMKASFVNDMYTHRLMGFTPQAFADTVNNNVDVSLTIAIGAAIPPEDGDVNLGDFDEATKTGVDMMLTRLAPTLLGNISNALALPQTAVLPEDQVHLSSAGLDNEEVSIKRKMAEKQYNGKMQEYREALTIKLEMEKRLRHAKEFNAVTNK